MQEKSFAGRWLSFAAAVLVTMVVVFVACPALVNAVPEMRRMADFVDESNIETGEFYYTDVECVGHANIGARSTFDYTPSGPHPAAQVD
ncbi:hypothetical protein GGQ74_002026 [Desulfobaculum xiamenense]|uniref:Uncharacterized protein n=1 Tax=Desulfobaculum xiamenense TaxID=995050 RepID=A0A846QPV5_9BACT|nr:hypothetical protein [Desulfobaculum xiamenense]NJB68353.1 hypothetical protein [Desulfobaculum xiamenense]